MKTICVDARLLGFTGIGSYLKNLLPILCTEHDKWIFITKKKASHSFSFLKRGEIIETEIPIFSPKELFLFHRLIPKCDLFWSPHFNTPILPHRAKKSIITFHDPYHQSFFDTLRLKEKIYTKFLLPRLLSKANRCITVSDFSKQEILRFNPYLSQKITTIHNGINLPFFSEKKDRATPFSRSYFLTVGSLKKHKNFFSLLKAFQNTLEKHPHDLIICGSAEGLINSVSFSEILKDNPILMQRVHFKHNIPDFELRSLYQNAHAFVFPSYYEGFGFPPLEAMAAGCPTITSSAASLPEVCGEATYYIDPYSIHSIEKGLLTLAHDPIMRDQLREKGFKQVHKFTWEESARKHSLLFQELLDTT